MPDFNEAGIAEKLNELYSLNDDDLLHQAHLICDDLKIWLSHNFSLTSQQQEYLDQVPERILFAWGAQMASVVIGRLDLEIDYGRGKPMRIKQTDINNNVLVRFIPGELADISGNGSIIFTYLP